MAYGYGTPQNIIARDLEVAAADAVTIIADFEEKVTDLEGQVDILGGQLADAEEDIRVLESDLDKAKNE